MTKFNANGIFFGNFNSTKTCALDAIVFIDEINKQK